MSDVLVFIVPAAVATLLSAPLWLIAYKRKYLVYWEVLGPTAAQLTWLGLYSLMLLTPDGPNKSLANIIETTFVIPFLSLVSAPLKVFVFPRLRFNQRQAANLYLMVNILGAAVTYFTIPVLPE